MSIISTIKNTIPELIAPTPTIRFACDVPGYEIGQPVQRAQDIKPDWMIKQAKEADRTNTPKFSACPGMHDYYRAGYIIPAWEDFEIIVTKTEFKVIIGQGKNFICNPHQVMQHSVLTGAANIDEDIKPHAIKFPCPWKVFTKPGYSAFVMPPLFHAPYLRDLFIYPGINDYDGYHTINVMFSPLKEMHVKIYAGTPMLQVIPYKREDITCSVGTITQKEHGEANFTYRSKMPGLYRKIFHRKKKYEISYD
jgi:hypothetical protein